MVNGAHQNHGERSDGRNGLPSLGMSDHRANKESD